MRNTIITIVVAIASLLFTFIVLAESLKADPIIKTTIRHLKINKVLHQIRYYAVIDSGSHQHNTLPIDRACEIRTYISGTYQIFHKKDEKWIPVLCVPPTGNIYPKQREHIFLTQEACEKSQDYVRREENYFTNVFWGPYVARAHTNPSIMRDVKAYIRGALNTVSDRHWGKGASIEFLSY